MRRAVVLAGGGVAGIAWELGVLRGIQDIDPELSASLIAADVVVGTSAGSAVAAQITSGTALEDLYAAQRLDAISWSSRPQPRTHPRLGAAWMRRSSY